MWESGLLLVGVSSWGWLPGILGLSVGPASHRRFVGRGGAADPYLLGRLLSARGGWALGCLVAGLGALLLGDPAGVGSLDAGGLAALMLGAAGGGLGGSERLRILDLLLPL